MLVGKVVLSGGELNRPTSLKEAFEAVSQGIGQPDVRGCDYVIMATEQGNGEKLGQMVDTQITPVPGINGRPI